MKAIGLALSQPKMVVSRWHRFRAAVHWQVILAVIVLCVIGLCNLYSATTGTRHADKFTTQMGWHVVGWLAFLVAAIVDYRTWVRLAWLGLGVTIAMLVLVLFMDTAYAKGSYRWLNLGVIRVQPSEVAKLMVILALARMVHESELARYGVLQLWIRVGVLAAPLGLIAIQPDLGTATLVFLILVSVGYLVMPSVWPMVGVTVGSLLSIPVIWELMNDTQKNRFLGFLDPESDPHGNGYHTLQSVYAVGSGRVWGKGYGEGTQNQFDFLPEHWTDFPYSVWAEEWGFVGSVALLLVFGLLIVWILSVGLRARDRTGGVICLGVAAMTFWHVVVNIGMVLGIAPVVGVTLPFISYGGSSLVVFLIAMGLVVNVSLRKHGY